jgi:hypothetical protein
MVAWCPIARFFGEVLVLGEILMSNAWWLQGYRDDEGLQFASDSDEQLLIYIPFMQVVMLHSALFKGPEDEGEICNSLLLLCAWILDLSFNQRVWM